MPKLKAKTFRIDLNGTEYDHLTVEANSRAAIEEALKVQRFIACGTDPKLASESGIDDDYVRDLMTWFGRRILVSWDLEDEDGPVPPTAEGVMGTDGEFIGTLLMSWWLQRAGIRLPLGSQSTDGDTSPDSPSLTTEETSEATSLGLGNLSKPI